MTKQPNDEEKMNERQMIVLMESIKELEKTFHERDKEIKQLKKEIKQLKKGIKLIEKLWKKKKEEMKKMMKMKKKNEELKKVMKEMNKKLEEERCELEELEDTNSALLTKERQSNDEIQEAHKELITGLRDLSGDGLSTIGVKMMGEIDEKPFLKICKQRFSGENIELEQAKLCEKWQKTLKDPKWYPFKRVGAGEKMKEVVDEEDDKLKNLKKEWGEKVNNAIKTALMELNEFNPSGRYPLPVLWNYEQEKKATLSEGIAHMTKEIKTLKTKLP